MNSEVVKALKKLELKFNKTHSYEGREIRGGGVYYRCSCGATGPSRANVEVAAQDYDLHVQKWNRELELTRKAMAAVNGVS
jgi:hypothetical protein